MSTTDDVRTSKRLSYVLRHAPGSVGVTLDGSGWVAVPDLLAALAAAGDVVSRADLERVVATSDKQRFELDAARDRVRARQGHSVPVDLDLPVTTPPPVLFHGTHAGVVDAILADGLVRGQRHAVHLSADVRTATAVGARRGRPVVLRVDAAAMHADGHAFAVTGNGVWLTTAVPPRYLAVLPSP
ncbi:RNA 2'-phosphotransferase [Cellulomonas sp. H30R-01]|uniref:RNA 2'-phosphotransferase n=1 Tax=Cellulomonas sp. H30R-01 TaxID=2704467 RepID=UPI00138CF067|nr:RNA 2'-phosphotransferase [Cellulomonas sp. H30R-01]QHT57967.1 RNA 2'-phosphotransferase [Cellulomonas sp. H30R-01]